MLGCDLKTQVFVIGIFYAAISIVWIALAGVLIQHPNWFEKDVQTKLAEDDHLYAVTNNSLTINGFSDFYSEEELTFLVDNEEENKYHELFLYEGREVISLSLIKLLCSTLLIIAAKVASPWLMVPWLLEELLELMVGIIYLSFQAVKKQSWDNASLLSALLYYSLGLYCMYSVVSYQTLLRSSQNCRDRMVLAMGKDWLGRKWSGLVKTNEDYDIMEEGMEIEFGLAGKREEFGKSG